MQSRVIMEGARFPRRDSAAADRLRAGSRFAACVLAALAALLSPLSAEEQGRTYIGLSLLSHHLNNTDLENFNPGVTIGRRFAVEEYDAEGFVEGGVFRNSYEETAPVGSAGMTWSLHRFDGQTELRAGGLVGIAYYRELSETLQDDYGIPNIGGFIPIVGLGVVVRYDSYEIRLITVPPAPKEGPIFNLSGTFAF